jgi:hypothetical protein
MTEFYYITNKTINYEIYINQETFHFAVQGS